MLDNLTLAITNIVLEYKPAKSAMLKVNLFTPQLVYLAKAVGSLNSEPFFSEDRVMDSLNLLSQLTDGEKPSQDWILANVKIDAICAKLLT
mmetsp:Transcript_33017/g.43490  ORF Transcript_33017/g.43490 Transcript_33017/m.43490 type:complete len:91 (-) Transcript_33017:2317-2589(-)